MLHKYIFGSFFLLALLLIIAPSASACSCAEEPSVLDAFEDSEAVVIAKVVALEKDDEKEAATSGNYKNVKSATMLVEKIYKGNVKIGEPLTFGQGGGSDCRWTFDENDIGERFLFYLGQPDKSDLEPRRIDTPVYFPGTCGRSRGADRAFDDLLYLNNLQKTRGRTRLSGTLKSWEDEAPSFAGLEIKITGKNKTLTTKTDKNGVYEVYNLPAGEYFVEPKTPPGWKINEFYLRYSRSYTGRNEDGLAVKNRVPIIVREGRHAALDLQFEIDNAIRGVVLSPTGTPLENICVEAIPIAEEDPRWLPAFDCTNRDGAFEITEVTTGTYFLVINRDGKMNDRKVFGKIYYPGTPDVKKASVVALAPGKFLSDITIQLPLTETIEVTGQFLYSDGKPVANGSVNFEGSPGQPYEDFTVQTDAGGRFTINIPKGARGKLSGSFLYLSKPAENCPRSEVLFRITGKNYMRAVTNQVEIEAAENLSDVKLTLPFLRCATEN